MELCLNPQLTRKWIKIIRKEAKDAKKLGKPFDSSKMVDATFLMNLIEELLVTGMIIS